MIACDGVWDVMTSDDVVKFVYEKLSSWVTSDGTYCITSHHVEEVVASVCDDILLECLNRGSTDNMSILLVLFPEMIADGSGSNLAYSSATPKAAVAERGDEASGSGPAYDTPECIASPSPMYLPGTLDEEEDEREDGDSNTFANDAHQVDRVPSPIRATKLF